MTHQEAKALLSPANIPLHEQWADLGAGSGTFTFALAEILGGSGSIVAVDKTEAVHKIQTRKDWANIRTLKADFTKKLPLDQLDGILIANALHFVFRQRECLNAMKSLLKPEGKLLLIEYDRLVPSPWVPYPISYSNFKKLTGKSGFSSPQKLAEHPSKFGNGMIYSAISYSI